jgi:hypothetical protein
MTKFKKFQGLERYIARFVDKTKNGHVFTCDISMLYRSEKNRTTLTEEEMEERRAWVTTRRKLGEYYGRASDVTSCEEMLRLRVAPPVLSSPFCSPRSQLHEYRAGHIYPQKLGAWKYLEQNVNSFQPEQSMAGKAKYADVLRDSLHAERNCSNEANEQDYIANQVLEPLRKAGVLEYKETTEVVGLEGRPDLASSAEPWTFPNGLPDNWSEHPPENNCDQEGASNNDDDGPNNSVNPGTSSSKKRTATTKFTKSPSSIIPLVYCEEIELLRELGRGNNHVRLARWRGQEVAVKSFDIFKDYRWFEREVRAYEHLKDVWGELVPKPYFISNMYGTIALLGMQLGREPNSSDTNFASERALLFSRLVHEYDFDHLDTDWGNVIYIPDGEGKERLVAMDLESHEILAGERRNRVT